MAAAGVEIVVRSEDMAVMGFTEIVRHLPRIYREFRKLERAIRARRPPSPCSLTFRRFISASRKCSIALAFRYLLRQPAALGLEAETHQAGSAQRQAHAGHLSV